MIDEGKHERLTEGEWTKVSEWMQNKARMHDGVVQHNDALMCGCAM